MSFNYFILDISIEWQEVQRGVNIQFEVEKTELQIKTDSAPGSKKEVKVFFFTAQKAWAGGIGLYFYSEPKYIIYYCVEFKWHDFPIDLPIMTSNEIVWRFVLERNSDEFRVKIYCNEKKVLDYLMSDQSCNGQNDWKSYWQYPVAYMHFNRHDDTASRYYSPRLNPATLNLGK